jgi:dihydroflavonol-4-reductase
VARYLVTGATGFLGTHLLEHLRRQGHDVVALCRGEADGALARLGATAEIAQGDVLDRESVLRAARGCDGVFHCAGKVSRKPEDAEELQRLHVGGTKTTLAACRDAGVRRAVIASTSGTVAVSTDPDHLGTEHDEAPIGLIARWPYYRSKLFAERAAFELAAPGFDVVSVNPTLLLGPGDLRGSSTEDVRLFLEKKIPLVPPGGLSYVDVRDAASGLALAMDKGASGDRYLLAACNLTIREFFARLSRLSGVAAPVLPMPRMPELARAGAELVEKLARRMGFAPSIDPVSIEMAHHFWYVDASHAEQVLGWTSRDPIETLADTVRDLRARGVVWPELEGPSALGA